MVENAASEFDGATDEPAGTDESITLATHTIYPNYSVGDDYRVNWCKQNT